MSLLGLHPLTSRTEGDEFVEQDLPGQPDGDRRPARQHQVGESRRARVGDSDHLQEGKKLNRCQKISQLSGPLVLTIMKIGLGNYRSCFFPGRSGIFLKWHPIIDRYIDRYTCRSLVASFLTARLH